MPDAAVLADAAAAALQALRCLWRLCGWMAIIAVNTAQSLHIPFRRPCAGALLHSLQAVHLMQPCSQVPPHTAKALVPAALHTPKVALSTAPFSLSPPPLPPHLIFRLT